MGLTFANAYQPVDGGEIIAGAHVREDVVDKLINNHNKLIGEYTSGDIIAHALTGHYPGPTYCAYQRTDTITAGAPLDFWGCPIPGQCKDFTNVTIDADLWAEDNTVDVVGRVSTAGGGTSGATNVGVGAWTSCSFTVALGTAADPIISLRGDPTAVTAKIRMRNVRVYYQKLTSPLSAGWTADSAVLPLDAAVSAQGEALPVWLAHVLQDAPARLLEARPNCWGMVNVCDTTDKGLYPSTASTSYEEVLAALRLTPRAAKIDARVLAEAAAANGCWIKLTCDETGDSVEYELGHVAPTYADWETAGTLDVVTNKPNHIRIWLKSTAAGTSYLYGLMLVEDYS